MLRHPRRSGRGNWRIYGTVPATAKGSASDAALSFAETAVSSAERSARKTAVLRFFFSEHIREKKNGNVAQSSPFCGNMSGLDQLDPFLLIHP